MLAALPITQMQFEPERQAPTRFRFLPVIHRGHPGAPHQQHQISDIISAVHLSPPTDGEASNDSPGGADGRSGRKKVYRARAPVTEEPEEHLSARPHNHHQETPAVVDNVVLGIEMAVKSLCDGQKKVRQRRKLTKAQAERRAAEFEQQRLCLQDQLESTVALMQDARKIRELFSHRVVPTANTDDDDDGNSDRHHHSPSSSMPSASIRRVQPSNSARSRHEDRSPSAHRRANSDTSVEREKMQEVFKTFRQPVKLTTKPTATDNSGEGKVHASNVMESVREVQRRRREREYHEMLEAQALKDFEDAERFRRFEERAAAARLQALENMQRREAKERALQEAAARADAERREIIEGRIHEKDRLLQARLARKNQPVDRRKLVGISFTAV